MFDDIFSFLVKLEMAIGDDCRVYLSRANYESTLEVRFYWMDGTKLLTLIHKSQFFIDPDILINWLIEDTKRKRSQFHKAEG